MSAAPPDQSPPPQAQLMQMAMGYAVPFLLRAAAELRVADHLATGQERTEHEYRMRLEKAGFKVSRVIPTNSSVSIIEAIPA